MILWSWFRLSVGRVSDRLSCGHGGLQSRRDLPALRNREGFGVKLSSDRLPLLVYTISCETIDVMVSIKPP